ncbi:hypothetical protein ACFULT_26590 [Rhodococcus sp. NPDC057297]|uniref:hypothetical protein n=1 Tax=Rhodococcus sp. NPDC057297 TaxID=3346090 RepID=UPI003633005A
MNINENRQLLMPIIAEALWNSEAEEEQGRRESSSFGVDDSVRSWDDLEDFERRSLTNRQSSAAIGVARAGWRPPPRVLTGDPGEIEAALDALPVGSIVESSAEAVADGECRAWSRESNGMGQILWRGTGDHHATQSGYLARRCAPLVVISQ